ncbi:MAG: hypothetical protein JO042_07445 [Sinobacteraceae bacterium]|nr:hypothetical protein [Nevskiaceae bacterium]
MDATSLIAAAQRQTALSDLGDPAVLVGLNKLVDAINTEARVTEIGHKRWEGTPIGEMQKLYQHFDEPFSRETELRMRAYLANNAQGKHGEHKYMLEEYGLTRQQVRDHFREYCRQFAIPCKD